MRSRYKAGDSQGEWKFFETGNLRKRRSDSVSVWRPPGYGKSESSGQRLHWWPCRVEVIDGSGNFYDVQFSRPLRFYCWEGLSRVTYAWTESCKWRIGGRSPFTTPGCTCLRVWLTGPLRLSRQKEKPGFPTDVLRLPPPFLPEGHPEMSSLILTSRRRNASVTQYVKTVFFVGIVISMFSRFTAILILHTIGVWECTDV